MNHNIMIQHLHLGFELCFFTLCSIRVFSVATGVCLFLVLPANYYGKEMEHKGISTEKLDVFGIGNVKVESKWYELYDFFTCTMQLALLSCILCYVSYTDIIIIWQALGPLCCIVHHYFMQLSSSLLCKGCTTFFVQIFHKYEVFEVVYMMLYL